jgi:putative ABC transport system ATP-binding protein
MDLIIAEQLTKRYGQGQTAVTALAEVNLTVKPGEFLAVMGPSGCGKSTLLHLLGGLDRPTTGSVILDGRNLASLDDDELTRLRRQSIGFVFQFFNLIPVLTAAENVALPLILDGAKPADANEAAAEWLTRLDLAERLDHKPDQLSGGQQQRVAIARALVAEPLLILADEPTGNLDSLAADEIARLLAQVASRWRRSVLMVTHNPGIAAHADRIVFLKDGRVVDETRLASPAGVAAAKPLPDAEASR